jgi:uncharacterized protein (TIGR02611 family)
MPPDQLGRDQPSERPVRRESRDADEATGILRQLSRRIDRVRSWAHARPGGAQIWRAGVALAGLLVIVVGIVLLPAPGPGWLIIFLGLGIWASEFTWARSLLTFARRSVGTWTAWLGRKPRWITALAATIGLLTLAAVAAGALLLFGNQ